MPFTVHWFDESRVYKEFIRAVGHAVIFIPRMPRKEFILLSKLPFISPFGFTMTPALSAQ